jgi:endo-1,4-beta-xylanase
LVLGRRERGVHDDSAGSRRSSVFQNLLGNGFIEHAFRTARAGGRTAQT